VFRPQHCLADLTDPLCRVRKIQNALTYLPSPNHGNVFKSILSAHLQDWDVREHR